MKTDGHVTIEKTAKQFKLQLILCWLAAVVAIFWIVGAKLNAEVQGREADFTGPTVLLVVAFIWYVITRIRIWWNHG